MWSKVPFVLDSSKWEVIEAGAAVRARKSCRELDQFEGGRGPVQGAGETGAPVWCGCHRNGIR